MGVLDNQVDISSVCLQGQTLPSEKGRRLLEHLAREAVDVLPQHPESRALSPVDQGVDVVELAAGRRCFLFDIPCNEVSSEIDNLKRLKIRAELKVGTISLILGFLELQLTIELDTLNLVESQVSLDLLDLIMDVGLLSLLSSTALEVRL